VPRVKAHGRAVVNLNPFWAQAYRVDDLAAGGALLSGGPPLRVGRRIRLLLELEGMRALGVDALVVRHTASHGVALRFIDLDPALEDLIHDVILSALSGRRLRPLPMDFGTEWEPYVEGAEGTAA
jgi:hypothetical protein